MILHVFGWIQSAVEKYGPQAPETTSSPVVSSTLYACDTCDTTYISTEMESCPQCGTTVERVPSGSELGFTSPRSS